MQTAKLYLTERQQNCDLDYFVFSLRKEEWVIFCFSQADMGADTHTTAHRRVGTITTVPTDMHCREIRTRITDVNMLSFQVKMLAFFNVK